MQTVKIVLMLLGLIFIIAGCDNKDNIQQKETTKLSINQEKPVKVVDELMYQEVPILELKYSEVVESLIPLNSTNKDGASVVYNGKFISEGEIPHIIVIEDDTIDIKSDLQNIKVTYRINDEEEIKGLVDLDNKQIKLLPLEDLINYTLIGELIDIDKNIKQVISYQFAIKRILKPRVEVNKSEYMQGDFFRLKVHNVDEQQTAVLKTDMTKYNINFFQENNYWVANISVPAEQKEGPISFIISIYEENQLIEEINHDISVIYRDFEKDYLYVNETISSMKNDEAYAILYENLNRARANPIDELLVDDKFVLPIDTRISSTFGRIRYVNDVISNRHSGVDLAANQGTEIKADQNGVVTLSKELPVTGNTIIIDHGQNIYSSFYHMSELIANEGEHVKTGDIIGKVGSTGFSTGPHLHWGIWVNGTFTDPLLLVENDLFEQVN